MSPKKSSNKLPAKVRNASQTPSAAARSSQSTPPKAAASRATGAGSGPDELAEEVLEFVQAIDAFKRERQRPFPSWSEVLEIVRALGYERRAG